MWSEKKMDKINDKWSEKSGACHVPILFLNHYHKTKEEIKPRPPKMFTVTSDILKSSKVFYWPPNTLNFKSIL